MMVSKELLITASGDWVILSVPIAKTIQVDAGYISLVLSMRMAEEVGSVLLEEAKAAKLKTAN